MNKNHPLYIVVTALLTLLFACLVAFPRSSASASPQSMEKERESTTSDILNAYTLPLRILEEAESVVDRSATLISEANFPNPVESNPAGTYLIVNGYTVFVDTPADKVNIIIRDGSDSFQIKYGQANRKSKADSMAGPGYYVGSRLVYTSENRDLVVYQSALGDSAYLEVSGTLFLDEQEYRFSLSRHSLHSATLRPEADQETRIRGQILSCDLTLLVDEKIITLPENGVEVSQRITNTRWTRGRYAFQFYNASIKTFLQEGKPSVFDKTWLASGMLLRNGLALGSMQLTSSATQVKFVTAVPWETIVLAAWDIQHP